MRLGSDAPDLPGVGGEQRELLARLRAVIGAKGEELAVQRTSLGAVRADLEAERERSKERKRGGSPVFGAVNGLAAGCRHVRAKGGGLYPADAGPAAATASPAAVLTMAATVSALWFCVTP